jgi:putative transposase
MDQQTTSHASSSSPIWEHLEAFVREQVQRFIQTLLEEEITALLGRPKSARRGAVDAPQGMRKGYGKPRRLSLTSGTITVRRPRVRGLGERFVSRVLPLFQRRTRQVGTLLPQLYLHPTFESRLSESLNFR